MIKSAQSLKDKLRNISREKDVDFNSVMRFYMYDCFIKRLSLSIYRDNFILKGGFYLSTLFGINTRSTMDIDTTIMNTSLSKENIIKIINEIINIDVHDHVKFQINKIEQIRGENEYGGLRVTIKFKFETIQDSFHIDIATGDPIYPKPHNYNYRSIVEEEMYPVKSYTLETILSEKIETILRRLEANGRMKDFYDIYLIYKFTFERLNKDRFRNAVKKTFSYRAFNDDLYDCFLIIEHSSILQKKWNAYVRKNKYARNITFSDTICCLKKYIDLLVPIRA